MAGTNRRKEKRTKKNQKQTVRKEKQPKEIVSYHSGKPMHQYKDRVFRMIFKEKKNFWNCIMQ